MTTGGSRPLFSPPQSPPLHLHSMKSAPCVTEETPFYITLCHPPSTNSVVMFIGMTFCLPLAILSDRKARAKQSAARDAQNGVTEPLLGDGASASDASPAPGTTWKEIFMLSIPTFFDLIATVLMNIGLLSVTASVYQMLRGAEMLFAAFLAVVFLKRRLNKYHYAGIACCICGIGLVGASSVAAGAREGGSLGAFVGDMVGSSAASSILMGMGLIVASQAVQAAQITFEDYFMVSRLSSLSSICFFFFCLGCR
jgi:drug/metabolite transporter (DMT)-like permease